MCAAPLRIATLASLLVSSVAAAAPVRAQGAGELLLSIEGRRAVGWAGERETAALLTLTVPLERFALGAVPGRLAQLARPPAVSDAGAAQDRAHAEPERASDAEQSSA